MAESVVVTSENQQNYIYLGQSKPAGRFALGSRYVRATFALGLTRYSEAWGLF